MAKKSAPEISPPETIVELGRLGALSDGVYAIALTLLVLYIRIPDNVLAGDLPARVVELAPKLLVYLISFIAIGGAWGSHQRMLSQIKRGDGLLVWYTLLSLLFVTLLPATSALLGTFPGEFITIAVFAANVILIQLSALWLWRHASRHGLVNPALDPLVVAGIGRRLIVSAAAFGISVVLGWFNPYVVYVVWIGLFLFLFSTDWLSWQLSIKPTRAAILLNGAASGQLDINHSGGLLNISAGAPENTLVEGSCVGGVDSKVTRESDFVKAQLRVPKGRGSMTLAYLAAWGVKSTPDWHLSLNPRAPLALNLETYASQVDLDFTGAHLTDLMLKDNSSAVTLRLPANAGQTVVRIESTTAYLDIEVPAGVAARIQTVKSMAELEFDVNRFPVVEADKVYCSSGYDTAANRVDIHVESSMGTVKII